MTELAAASPASDLAAALVSARRAGRALPAFPGPVPADAATAYAAQDAAILARGGAIGGWKVAMVRPEFRAEFAAPRLIGPVFSDTIVPFRESDIEVAIIDSGFAAVEAEFAVRLFHDLPPRPRPYTDAEIAAAVGALRVAVEIAGSPVASLNALGPAATIVDFGGNAGLVVGPAVAGGLSPPLEALATAVAVNDREVGRGSAASVPGGPLAAVAFCVETLRARGRGLAAGDYVSTGATTGVHDVRPGDRACVTFPNARLSMRFAAASGTR